MLKYPSKNMRIIVALCATVAFLLGVSLFLFFNGQEDGVQAVGKISPFLAVPFCYTVYKCLDKVKMRALWFAGIYSLLLCLFIAISFSYMTLNTFIVGAKNIAAIILATPLTTVYVQRFLLIFDADNAKNLEQAYQAAKSDKTESCQSKCKLVRRCGHFLRTKLGKFYNFAKAHPVKAFLILWLVMFVLWLPYLFAFWPSVWAFDAYGWGTVWLLRGGVLNTWHPILHSLWLSLPITASWNLFGSYIPGAAFYTITQMIVLSWIFTKVVTIVARWNLSRFIPAVIWLIFALFPVFPFWSLVATKDVIFSGLFALCCTCIADLIIYCCYNKENDEAKNGRFKACFLRFGTIKKTSTHTHTHQLFSLCS